MAAAGEGRASILRSCARMRSCVASAVERRVEARVEAPVEARESRVRRGGVQEHGQKPSERRLARAPSEAL